MRLHASRPGRAFRERFLRQPAGATQPVRRWRRERYVPVLSVRGVINIITVVDKSDKRSLKN